MCEYVILRNKLKKKQIMLNYVKTANGIKATNQLTLKKGQHPGLPSWAQCNQSVLKTGSGREKKSQYQIDKM